MQPFTLTSVRIFDGENILSDSAVRVAESQIEASGDASIARAGDEVVATGGAFLMPGLIDAHVHLLPGAAVLAAGFGVTTLIDQFSKLEIVAAERAADCVKAQIRSSTIGATAPGGHPTIAYAPFPYVTGPQDAEQFVTGRIAEGADHLKIIYDDGSGAMLELPALTQETIRALVAAAHRADLLVVAHVSTGPGAVLVASCGVDVLAHAPFSIMTDRELNTVARSGVAVITTLSIIDGFPRDGVMPLLNQSALTQRLTGRWRRVIERQGERWMPPEAPDGLAHRENVLGLFESGVPIVAGTDAPNPGLLPGPSLHRELQHLVHAGLHPIEALRAATSTPARVFGLADRGVIEPGRRADLVLLSGDPTNEISDTQLISHVWIGGESVDPSDYPGSATERAGIRWLRESNRRIVQAIVETWPNIPGPQEVLGEDGDLIGRVIPSAGGWRPQTTLGVSFGVVATRDQAIAQVVADGESLRDGLWWVLTPGDSEWQRSAIETVSQGQVRINDTTYSLDDLDISHARP